MSCLKFQYKYKLVAGKNVIVSVLFSADVREINISVVCYCHGIISLLRAGCELKIIKNQECEAHTLNFALCYLT